MGSFVEKVTSVAMQDRFAKICERRPEVRVVSYIVNRPRILEWIHSVGVCDDEELRSLVPPLPPEDLRRITAAPELPEFLWTGLVDIEHLITLYEENRSDADPARPSILDFGCGCGRLSRFLNDYTKYWSVYACDVNAGHVNWCKNHLKTIQTTQNDVLPPLPYQNQMFNLVYSLSVFTHLPEDNANQWLSEMHRILAPNGTLILTTSGFSVLETTRDSTSHQAMFDLDRQAVIDIINSFKEQPFVFHKYNPAPLSSAQAGEEYGNAFIHPDWIYENWDNGEFKVLRHIPGGLRNWQDIVILRRR